MKCPNCGNEVNDNICTNCGTKITGDGTPILENSTEEENQESLVESEDEETVGKFFLNVGIEAAIVIGFSIYFRCNLIIPILYTITQIIVFVCEKKNKKTGKLVVGVISLILAAVCLWNIYNGYQDNKYIKIAQKENYESIDMDYKWLFDEFSGSKVKWTCKKREDFTVVDPIEDHIKSGSYNAIVTVKGPCTLYDEPTKYLLTFYVSKNKTVPVKLILDGITYNDSSDISNFIWSVYEYDISK